MEEKIVVSVAEAAILLDVCEKVLREQFLKIPGFPFMQVGGKGGKILIPRASLVEWANEYWKTQSAQEV